MSNSFTLTNISQLVTNNSAIGNSDLGVITNAAITVTDGIVSWVGQASDADSSVHQTDVGGRALIPGFVDSHSHLMFAGDRSEEFAARMAGVPYSAGGIKITTDATRSASDDQLRNVARGLIKEMHESGTTTVEIKSGYGLDVATEERSVRIASELTDEVTFLGAHVVAPEFSSDSDAYVDLVTGEMLNACAPHSNWIDVFCDRGAFTTAQSRRILQAGIAKQLKPRIHLNQLEQGDGIAMAIDLDCASADHLTYLTDEDINALAASNTVAGLVPGADFSTRAPQYPRGRDLLDAGAVVALSPDCNPGSSFTTNMPLMIALAVREMNLRVDEALFAATMGGAISLRRDDVGHLSIGAKADFVLLNAPSYIHLAYRPGVPLISTTWKNGNVIFTKGDLA
ncbi:MAG: imidazolonepropionase [Actinomycetes bacterium]